ncbi:MAG: helix-turn-helix domain-containing protein [Novosphingobium sp.]
MLTVAVIQLLLFAFALSRTLANRAANRTLAALLCVMAAVVTPWLIGFAGFYDKWPWLSFAPFQVSLGVPPLAWLYVVALTRGHWPDNGWRHLLPAIAQFGYLAACFVLPLEAKLAWADRSSAGYSLVVSIILMAQMLFYGRAAASHLRTYRTALREHVADQTRFAVRWLSAALAALGLLFAVWASYLVWDLVEPLGYFGLMGLYIAIAAAALYLGTEGWRHAALPFPHLSELIDDPPPPGDNRDWAAQGRAWAELVRRNGWARDEDLTLARLARLIGTNSAYLSRAINRGEGTNFASFIAGLRAEAVAARLRSGDPADLLTIALEEGFGSNASFNRAFIAALGEAPSSYRRRVSKGE